MLKEKRKNERSLKKNQNKTEKLEAIKNSKYVILKNSVNLNNEEKEKLEQVKKPFPDLGRMYEKFRNIYENNNHWLNGILNLADWLKKANKILPKSSKTIKNWLGEIISYFDCRTTNGIVEGINNKLKLIKRTSYGFRNFDNFRTRVFLDWYF